MREKVDALPKTGKPDMSHVERTLLSAAFDFAFP